MGAAPKLQEGAWIQNDWMLIYCPECKEQYSVECEQNAETWACPECGHIPIND